MLNEHCSYDHHGVMVNLSETIPLPRGEAKTFLSSVPSEIGVAVTCIHLAIYKVTNRSAQGKKPKIIQKIRA